jgi:hypothetical protein
MDSLMSDILIGLRPIKVGSSIRPGPERLVSLKAYECLPHGEAGPKRLQGTDSRAELACGKLWSPHLGVVYIEVKLREMRQTRLLV